MQETQSLPDKKQFSDLGPKAPPFEKYFDEHIEDIKRVQEMLSVPLDDMPAVMDNQAREVEAWHARMKGILAWADGFLRMSENLKLLEIGKRSKEYTDLDRETALAAAVVRERRFRDVMRGVVEAIETRISYSQSRLRAFVAAEGQKFQ